MKLTIGVMGASGGDLSEEIKQRAYRLGEAIAERDATLITGGCPGLPYEAVRGAKTKGGLVVGISPGLSIDEHQGKYRSPVEGFDVFVEEARQGRYEEREWTYVRKDGERLTALVAELEENDDVQSVYSSAQ